MRQFTGTNPSQISDPKVRDHATAVEEHLFALSDAIKNLGDGREPVSGGGQIMVTDHGALSGLDDDDHSQYALLAGRSSSQTLYGGTASSGGQLLLQSSNEASNPNSVINLSAGSAVTTAYSAGTTVGAAAYILGAASASSASLRVAPSSSTTSHVTLGSIGVNHVQLRLSGYPTSTDAEVVLTGITGQTANLQTWKNGAGTTLAYIDKDGNASFTSISAPGVALLATEQTFTDTKTFAGNTGSNTPGLIVNIAANPAAYDGLSGMLFDDASGFKGQLFAPATNFSADRYFSFPDASGEFLLSTGTQNVTNKTLLTTGNTLRCSTASSGVAFVDTTTTTKALRFVLSGASANNHSIVLSNTAARTYTLPDFTGTVLIVGSTQTIDNTQIASRTRSVFIPCTAFVDGSTGVATTQLVGTFPTAYVATQQAGSIIQTQQVATFTVPQDYSAVVGWQILYTNQGTSTNATHWDLYYLSAANAEDFSAANSGTMSGESTPSATSHVINTYQIGTTSTALAAGETVRLGVQRDPTHVNDTNTGTMNFLGVRFDYTADM